VELQGNLEKFRAEGLGVAAISYDSPAVLKSFADRRHITFPLLSDPESKIIRAFGILNEQIAEGTPQYGIPHPGTYIVDRAGRVTAKYFEDDYTQRYMSAEILVRQFGESAGAAHATVEATCASRHRQAMCACDPDSAFRWFWTSNWGRDYTSMHPVSAGTTSRSTGA